MITSKVFELVANLKNDKSFMKGLLRSMDSQYVRTGIGLVDHNYGLNPSDKAEKFGHLFVDYIKRQDESLKNELLGRIRSIEREISKHIK